MGLLIVGCGGAAGHGSSAAHSKSGGANSATGGDPKETLLAALKKMDGLDTYQAELSMPNMDLGGGSQMTTSSHMEVSVKDNVIYQVMEISGGPIGPTKQESLLRGSEYLVRGGIYNQAFGESDPSVTADTWFRAPGGGQGGTMVVSMYFAPAAQAITTVSDQGSQTVRGTEVTVYRAELDPAKFRSALSSENIPGGIPADKIPLPTTIDYGVGADGYVHSVALALGDAAPRTTFELHDYNTPLNLPNPTHVADLPTS
ncbi:hypothetical protein [Mycobacterium talmoniae]|uniref:Lipoprotein n=1 Tax=Mycobacterium talmoniae TaxID=1858794 RepID=A0A1S1NNM4_9MYCO|nr:MULTISPECIES: hypothetical protein [Mycobacterium]OHV05750.1 hypothetical protein BKN37_04715 [Mycobacterium talmoniae]TDH56620.1 hypothetical protein E2F47_05675 [Mycobacterium eburneum]